MIEFKDWTIRTEDEALAHQFDNLTRRLTVKGNLPEGWDWVMIVKAGDCMDYLPLTQVEEGVGITLTANQLSLSGAYALQLRGTKGELVRHTNVIHTYIYSSLSGDEQWPELPGAFTELERRMQYNTDLARQYAQNHPIIGENGTWWIWDQGQYADTGYNVVEAVFAALPDGDEVYY